MFWPFNKKKTTRTINVSYKNNEQIKITVEGKTSIVVCYIAGKIEKLFQQSNKKDNLQINKEDYDEVMNGFDKVMNEFDKVMNSKFK
jgi:hypothetical protein